MTRFPPQGQDGYQSGQQYGNEHPQYGNNGAPYGNSNWNQGLPPPRPYDGEYNASAQSYYGPNNQPYQQYPPGPNNQGNGPSQYPMENYQQSPPPPQHQGYGPGSGYLPYGQPYGGQVDSFRAHYEQPHGPMPPNQEPYGAYPPQQNSEDRGLMGALAGGAAGGFAGHKVHHGILGGLGGAVAGSMLEDAYKRKHKKGKKPRSRGGSHSSSSGSSSSDSSDDEKHHHKHGREADHGVMAGNFHASARDVRLEGHCMLVAEVMDVHGHHMRSNVDLNDCFTNVGGQLKWARGGDFAATARDIRLLEGGNVMEAELGDGRGGWQWNRVNLNERISNDNGRLTLL